MGTETQTPTPPLPLHSLEVLRRTPLNRAFALVYACAISALLYRHACTLLSASATTFFSFSLSFSLLLSDAVLAFMWVTIQSFRICPVRRSVFIENLSRVVEEKCFPALDVFICTADPLKEPPLSVVNTALSVMAYDYPTEKVSVYVSDDGGSQLTLFAFMEAAKFARQWLPFCRKNEIEERCPDVYFGSTLTRNCAQTEKMKIMYESMKEKIESVMERGGGFLDDLIISDHERQAFNKWTPGFTRRDHPTIIEVLLDSGKDKDITGNAMPNLVYVSREKSSSWPHHFKAGALNVLLRVSETMSNAPVVLNLDCDMYSNDPRTPLRVLCYLFDPAAASKLAYVQFPQRFHGIDKHDIYGNEHKILYQLYPAGSDAFAGPNYVGSGCFFRRRALFGGPSSLLSSRILKDKPITSATVSTLSRSHHVASCTFEHGTDWGYKIGFRYGSLSEDYHTGYWLHNEGWKSVFCNPDRAAFLGDTPLSLNDALSQNRRWCVGLLQVAFSRYNPITFGIRSMGLLVALNYAYNAYWAIWSIPIIIYAIVPQLALINGVSMFPAMWDPWFYLYWFLFLGAYGQDAIEFTLAGSTIQRWWNDQRMWLIRGVSSYLFGIAILNLIAFVVGFAKLISSDGMLGQMLVQLFISGFGVVNSWPIYEAIFRRTDGGEMPAKITTTSILLVLVLLLVAYIMF
ncbi:PREDICTED: cellulose synthase-like protein G3 [Nelumbo nucifera]|uniref:Cellulose synthase-like protein G3 n=1 Tax=Nelumbo nucifera TaxID=4432 RepID=A0A1U8Q6V9_NELNU|nr:PREDICTED: cellulose synthase-like protein G3 [Nelumbo nucifera]